MDLKKKVIFILAFLLVLSSFTFSAINVVNGSFETGDFTNWTVAQDVNATNPLDQLFVSADANVFVGSNATYDLNSFDGSFEVAGIELGGCAGAFKMAYRFGSSNGVQIEANEVEIITQSDPQVPIYHETYPSLICGTSPTAGNLAITLLTRQPPTSAFGGTRITHTSQLVEVGDKICVNTQAGHSVSGTCEASVTFDLVQLVGHTLTVIEPSEPIPSNDSFTMRTTIIDVNGSNIETADVNITLNGDTNVMVFSNGQYRITFPLGLASGNYSFDVNSIFESVSKGFNGTLEVKTQEFQYLTITPIKNIASFSYASVDFIPVNEAGEMIWRVDSNSSVSETATFKIINGRTDGRQYFIFTSSDGTVYSFDDTLTFGSTNENPIQKIWNERDKFYTYSFDDTLTANQTKYYKLTYRSPYRHWFSIADSEEWQQHLTANVLDQNTFFIDEYSISSFTNIRSILKEEVPDVFEDETKAFEFQFTAYSDVNQTLLYAGITKNNSFSNDSVESITLTDTPKRFSITIDATDFDSQLLFKSANTTSAKIFVTDYSIVARGFFTKRLELFKANTDPLDVFLLNGISKRYIQEGLEFRIKSEAYDREEVFNELIVEAYLDSVSANNLVSSFKFDLKVGRKAETVEPFNQLFPPVIDLNGTANNPDPPRTIILRARITDDNSITVAIQSQTITFLQYPYFPNDLDFQFFPTEKRLGKHPAGILELRMKDISVLEALDLRIYSDANTVDAPNHRETIYKDTDFSCIGNFCNLQITVDDYVFEDVNLTTITWFAILNTEFLDQDNNLTRIDRRIFVTPIIFDVAKIYQVVHRSDRTYRQNEEIPLVLILKDSEADNIKNKIDVYLTLQNCDNADGNAGNCVDQTIRFKPTGFTYDPLYNLNYYFFRHLYVLDDGSLLPDGNYISFRATVTDKTGVRTTITPVLTDKCKNNDVDVLTFFANVLTWNIIGAIEELGVSATGCNTEQENVVTTAINSEQEHRILIDEDHSVQSPSQDMFACITPDSNNVFGDPLKQDILCFSWYQVNEKPIDNFRIRITNGFSDLSVTGIDKQYIEFNIPYEVIANNDVALLKEQLETNQNTSIDTVGEFIFEGLRQLALGQANVYGLNDLDAFVGGQGQGVISNIGVDVNFNQAFSPAVVEGLVFYKIKGLPILNANDFSREFAFRDNFNSIDRSNFISVLRQNDLTPSIKESELQIFVSDFTVPIKFKDTGILVIDEEPSDQTINRANLSEDSTGTFAVVPNVLVFNIQSTMFFNNFSENDTRSIVISFLVNIRDSLGNTIFNFADDIFTDPVGTITDFLQTNLLFIMILLILAVIGGVIFVLWSRR